MYTKSFPAMDQTLSVIGFGCWATGGSDVWNNTTDQASIKAIQRAIELGVTFFDVAPVYGLGHAETVLGQAIKGQRDKVFIATKCGLVWDEQQQVTVNLTAASIKQEIDASLQRLGTDYIDLYQMHWPDPDTSIEESMAGLLNIQQSGKIRYIGVSNFALAQTEEAMSYGPVVSHQGLYNVLEHNPDSYHNIPLAYRVQDEILPYCAAQGIAFLPYSPIFQGLLTDDFQPSGNFDKNDVRSDNPKLNGELFKTYFQIRNELKALADEIGKPLSQLAINWLIEQPAVGPVICGAQTAAHVEENVGSVDWKLTPDVMGQIDRILAPYKAANLV